MGKNLLSLLLCLCVYALAANTLGSASYSMQRANKKDFVYVNRSTALSVTVGITEYAQDAALALTFLTSEGATLQISPTSSCVTDAGVELFKLGDNGFAAAVVITSPQTCTFHATIAPSTANLVFNKISADGVSGFDCTPFTTANTMFEASWGWATVMTTGATPTLTISSNIPFSKGDVFYITATNGAPFLAATACINSGTQLNELSVTAQGSRLFFVALDTLPSIQCATQITVGPTSIESTNYVFSAPAHSLAAATVPSLLVLRDNGDHHVRLGFLGTTTGIEHALFSDMNAAYRKNAPEAVPETQPLLHSGKTVSAEARTGGITGNSIYVAIPASAVRAGDTVKLHLGTKDHMQFSSCYYHNKALAGAVSQRVDIQRFADSFFSASLILAAPLLTNSDGFVELHCPVELADVPQLVLTISAVSVPSGVFAAVEPQPDWMVLIEHNLMYDLTASEFGVYNKDLGSFRLGAIVNAFGAYSHTNVDVSVQGATFTNVEQLQALCTFKDSQNKTWTPSSITVTNGQARIRIDSSVSPDLTFLAVACPLTAPTGQTVELYDNVAERVIAQDTVRASTLLLSFGDGKQTHFMAPEALHGLYYIPFTLSVKDFYVPEARDDTQLAIVFNIHDWQVYQLPPILDCSVGKVSTYSGSGHASVDGQEYIYSSLNFFIERGENGDYEAQCTGITALNPATGIFDATLNKMSAAMFRQYFSGISNSATSVDLYKSSITFPKVLAIDEFSFRATASVLLGSPATFTVGHKILPKDASFTLTFDHDIDAAATSCVVSTEVILDCQLDNDKRKLTCTKTDSMTETPCALSLTFAGEFTQHIRVTSAFTGLPAGVVFHPTFTIVGQSGQYNVTPRAGLKFRGQEVYYTISLPRAPRTSDVLKVRVTSDGGSLEYLRFEPSTGDTSSAATMVDGVITLPLTLLDLDKAAKDNLVVYFRHIDEVKRVSDPTSYATFTFADVQLASSYVTYVTDSLRITYVPSAKASFYNIVRLDHGDMPAGSTIAFQGVSYTAENTPQLYCGAQTPLSADQGTFTLASAITATEPCFARFTAYELVNSYWQVTTTINSVSTNVYAHASTVATASPAVISPAALVVNKPATVTLRIPDFTTAFVQDNTPISFQFDVNAMSITEAKCGTIVGTVDAQGVNIPLMTATAPLSSLGDFNCEITLTPLLASIAPKFTDVSIIGHSFPEITLPAFRDNYAPSVTITFPPGPLSQEKTYEVAFQVAELNIGLDSTLSFSSELADPLFNIQYCTDNDGIVDSYSDSVTFYSARSESDAPLSFTCTMSFYYISAAPTPFAIKYVNGETTADFTATASATRTNLVEMKLISTTPNSVVYEASLLIESGTYAKRHVSAWGPGYDRATISSNCNRDVDFAFEFVSAQEGQVATCIITVVVQDAYDPAVAEQPLVLTWSDESTVQLPFLNGIAPTLCAKMSTNQVLFSFYNTDTATVLIENVWDLHIPSDAPINLISLTDDTTVVGKVIASADGKHLEASVNAESVLLVDGKYSVKVPCYFSLGGISDTAVHPYKFRVKFTAGSATTTVRYVFGEATYRQRAAAAAGVVVPGAPYDVELTWSVAGNRGDLVIDYNNTVLKAPISCFAATTEDGDYSHQVEFTANEFSLSVALSEENTFLVYENVRVALKCSFDTLTEEELPRSGVFSKAIHVSFKNLNGRVLHSAPVIVATPYYAPTTALVHEFTFERDTLFAADLLARLAQLYANGLREIVPALEDGQVRITRQIFVAPPPAKDTIPAPIITQFAPAAGSSVDVSFAVTSTDAVTVISDDLTAAGDAISTSFTNAGFSFAPKSLTETVIDGECASRCGLGCALCAEGETCSLDSDCMEAHCNSNGVCGPEPSPPGPTNAAHIATLSMTALVLTIFLMF